MFIQTWLSYWVRHPEMGATVACALVISVFERALDLRPEFQPRDPRSAYRRVAGNFGLASIWLLVATSYAVLLSLALAPYAWMRQGLFHHFDWPDWLKCILAFLALDLFYYSVHRLEHRIPLLWRFHSVHHSDSFLDASTTLRKHPVSGVVTTSLLAAFVLAMGFRPEQILIYSIVSGLIGIYSHSGIPTPGFLSSGMKNCFVIRPVDHTLHHSDFRGETDSNFGQVLSVWDRLFGTFRERKDLKNFRFGLTPGDLQARGSSFPFPLKLQWINSGVHPSK